MAFQVSRPLDLPEILKITFAFLDNKSLAACTQVNSLWGNQATRALWMHPPIFALASLLDSGRARLETGINGKYIGPTVSSSSLVGQNRP